MVGLFGYWACEEDTAGICLGPAIDTIHLHSWFVFQLQFKEDD
jgi:hypothetical protein